MKFKPVLPKNDVAIFNALNTSKFEEALLVGVCGKIYGIKDVLTREAEFYVQKPDVRLRESQGIPKTEIRLTGVGRNGRTVEIHHQALIRTAEITAEFLSKFGPREVFSVLMLDGEIPRLDDPMQYSCVPEYLLRVDK